MGSTPAQPRTSCDLGQIPSLSESPFLHPTGDNSGVHILGDRELLSKAGRGWRGPHPGWLPLSKGPGDAVLLGLGLGLGFRGLLFPQSSWWCRLNPSCHRDPLLVLYSTLCVVNHKHILSSKNL